MNGNTVSTSTTINVTAGEDVIVGIAYDNTDNGSGSLNPFTQSITDNAAVPNTATAGSYPADGSGYWGRTVSSNTGAVIEWWLVHVTTSKTGATYTATYAVNAKATMVVANYSSFAWGSSPTGHDAALTGFCSAVGTAPEVDTTTDSGSTYFRAAVTLSNSREYAGYGLTPNIGGNRTNITLIGFQGQSGDTISSSQGTLRASLMPAATTLGIALVENGTNGAFSPTLANIRETQFQAVPATTGGILRVTQFEAVPATKGGILRETQFQSVAATKGEIVRETQFQSVAATKGEILRMTQFMIVAAVPRRFLAPLITMVY